MPKNQPSLARSLFERITVASDPAGVIQGFVRSKPPIFETEYLDFKGEPKDTEVKEIWSKAIAGFANTEGGVLIWGIDARKDKAKGIDAAQGFRLIQNTAQFKTRLTELLRDATDPPLPGVELVEIPDSAASVQGFVVCYIPEGDFKPYRAEHADRQYYHRVSDSFHVINRSLLASLFYPRSKARLAASVDVGWNIVAAESRAELCASVIIENYGQASAKDVVLQVEVEPQELDSLRAGSAKQWSLIETEKGWAAFHSNVPIHPGAFIQACNIYWETPITESDKPQPSFEYIDLSLIIHADSMEAVYPETISITPDDVASGFGHF